MFTTTTTTPTAHKKKRIAPFLYSATRENDIKNVTSATVLCVSHKQQQQQIFCETYFGAGPYFNSSNNKKHGVQQQRKKTNEQITIQTAQPKNHQACRCRQLMPMQLF